jgi:hypothetical protein
MITHSYKTIWESDKDGHWHECSVCGTSDGKKTHTPGAAATESTAQKCTTCGYVIKAALGHTHNYKDEWSNNANNHWHECSGCGDRKDEGGHIYDNACDKTCKTCGYVRTVTHTYKTAWESDDNQHWHVCSVCGAPGTKTAHGYDNDSDADCNTCGYTRVVETPPTQTESSSTVDTVPDETTGGDQTTDPIVEPDTTPETTSGSGDKGGDGLDITVVIIIAICAVALGVVGGIVIGKIKKK